MGVVGSHRAVEVVETLLPWRLRRPRWAKELASAPLGKRPGVHTHRARDLQIHRGERQALRSSAYRLGGLLPKRGLQNAKHQLGTLEPCRGER